MRVLILLPVFLLALTSCTPKAAVFGTETGQFGASFDHYAINVDDLDESVAFYQKVLALEEIYDGTEKDNIRWLSLGNGMSLHVIQADRSEVRLQKGVHLSIAVQEFDTFVQHLRRPPQHRRAGVRHLRAAPARHQPAVLQLAGRTDGVQRSAGRSPAGLLQGFGWLLVRD